MKILLMGFGNPGRLDDGLGPALAEAVAALNLPDVTVDADYQLMVEDAESVARHDCVIFADAAVDGPEPFSFSVVEPRLEVSFSSHSVDPRAVLGLAQEMFKAKTQGYLLGIRGYEFNEFGQQLSVAAQKNLAAALEFVTQVLADKDFSRSLKKRS